MSRTVMAHIEKIIQTYPIEGADKVEMAQILDYHVVVKKDGFKAGDLAVYIEIDSILPDGLPLPLQAELATLKKTLKKATGEDIKKIEEKIQEIISQNTRPEFEFLRQKRFRILSQKYSRFADKFGNPIISMGIIFPMTILPKEFLDRNEGVDVTSLLGVMKIVEDEEDEKISEEVKTSSFEKFLDKKLMRFSFYRTFKKEFRGKRLHGSWLSIFPPQSDEIPAQKIYSKMLEVHGKEGYYETEKMEGQNLSFYLNTSRKFFGLLKQEFFGVCSHHRHIPTDDGSDFWKTVREIDAKNKLKKVGKNIFVRGERLAPKLQENIYKFTKNEFMVFDVYDMDNKRFYNYEEMIEFCKTYGFNTVPILSDNFVLPETVQEILAHSNGKSVFGENVLREGVVIRKKNDVRISFKARSPEYLALHGK